MGEPREPRKIIDDVGGLYTHASEVYRAGQRTGRDKFFEACLNALRQISVKQECGPVNGPEADIATRGFHVAQDCCKTIREIKERFDNKRETV